jgi:hypothetical protein
MEETFHGVSCLRKYGFPVQSRIPEKVHADELVKIRNPMKFVIPAKAGIQGSR